MPGSTTRRVTALTVTSTATEVIRIGTGGGSRVAFYVRNRSGGAALTAASIRAKIGTNDPTLFPELVIGANPGASVYPIVGHVGGSATLAANASMLFVVNCEGLTEVSLWLTCGTSTTIDVTARVE
jgi:hypothetical protein